MELRHLRYFLSLAEDRHFGRAAARLHIAQPALSQQIKQLEKELGIALFHRTTRRVELTEAGTHFKRHAQSIVASTERAESDMAQFGAGRAGRVAIGFIGTATYDVLPEVARTVRRELPEIDLALRGELLSPQLMDGLPARTFDLVVVRPELVPRPGLEVETLRSEPLVAVLPAQHPLAGRRRIDLRSLADEAFVMHPSAHRSSIHDQVLTACAKAGFQPASILEVAETATLVVFVAAGLGVAVVPEPVRSLGLGGVSYVSITRAPLVDLALARRSDEASPAVREVAAIVERCASDK